MSETREQILASAVAEYRDGKAGALGPTGWCNVKLGEHGQAGMTGGECATIDNLRLPLPEGE